MCHLASTKFCLQRAEGQARGRAEDEGWGNGEAAGVGEAEQGEARRRADHDSRAGVGQHLEAVFPKFFCIIFQLILQYYYEAPGSNKQM